MKASTKFINNTTMVNPFVQSLSINVRYKKVSETDILGNVITNNIPLESDRYCKLFIYNDKNKSFIRALSANSLQMYLYIISELRSGEDVIRINRKQYMEDMNIKSLTTIHEAIKDLIINGIICATVERELYWINPAIIFCGSRLHKYPDNMNVVNGEEC